MNFLYWCVRAIFFIVGMYILSGCTSPDEDYSHLPGLPTISIVDGEEVIWSPNNYPIRLEVDEKYSYLLSDLIWVREEMNSAVGWNMVDMPGILSSGVYNRTIPIMFDKEGICEESIACTSVWISDRKDILGAGFITSARIFLEDRFVNLLVTQRRAVILHELLHGIGFQHTSNRGSIMYPVIQDLVSLGEIDIALLSRAYGYKQ